MVGTRVLPTHEWYLPPTNMLDMRTSIAAALVASSGPTTCTISQSTADSANASSAAPSSPTVQHGAVLRAVYKSPATSVPVAIAQITPPAPGIVIDVAVPSAVVGPYVRPPSYDS